MSVDSHEDDAGDTMKRTTEHLGLSASKCTTYTRATQDTAHALLMCGVPRPRSMGEVFVCVFGNDTQTTEVVYNFDKFKAIIFRVTRHAAAAAAHSAQQAAVRGPGQSAAGSFRMRTELR